MNKELLTSAEKAELAKSELDFLEEIDITTSRNGYPRELHRGVIGFETFEQAEKIAEKYRGKVVEFTRDDGWNFYYSNGTIWKEYDIAEIEKVFDYFEDVFEKAWSLEQIKDELDFLKEGAYAQFVDGYIDKEEYDGRIERIDKVLSDVVSFPDDKVAFLNRDTLEIEYEDRYTMHYWYDVTHYEIGVEFFKDIK